MTDDLVLISYPSGGFGNFIFHALTVHASSTFKINNQFEFSLTGDSHNTVKYTNVYYNDPDNYQLLIPDSNKTTLILCDNGIINDSYDKINKTFPNAKIIRLCISKKIRPVIYQTCIIKAKRNDLISESKDHVTTHWTDSDQEYTTRENFTLLYHNWPFDWKFNNNCINVDIERLIIDPVNTIIWLIKQINSEVINLDQLIALCNQWQEVNQQYFKIYWSWENINRALDNDCFMALDDIIDLHSQGYINYCIERKFNVTIPVYDYRNWFKNTDDIKEMITCLK